MKQKQDDVDTIRFNKLLFDFQGPTIKTSFDWHFLNRKRLEKISHYGGVAQLGEHLPCKQGVKGSIPFISTIGCKTENVVHKELKQRSKVNLGCAKHKGS